MRELLPCPTSVIFNVAPHVAEVASASDQGKNDDRLRNSGTVLAEILHAPNNTPQDLLDKADCVVVFPSVLKAAFIVGGSYRRGAMSCRKGDGFRGPLCGCLVTTVVCTAGTFQRAKLFCQEKSQCRQQPSNL
jgi:lipid-binding SYLF domain-containing protein